MGEQKINIGDPVLVIQSYGGTPIPAQVVGAAQVWLTIASDRIAWRMRRDTQYETAGPNPHGARFFTPEQYENKKMRDAAIKKIREHGIVVKLESRWWGRWTELAELLGDGPE